MGKIFYISDLHFGHFNVIRFDGRHFDSVEEMEQKLIENWNNAVSNEDTVYILGDFCWGKEGEWIRILKQLKGQKVLIRGNHDIKNMSKTLRSMFQDVKDYKEITDDSRHVILCHFPMPFYKADYNPYTYHLYGHVHVTPEHDFMEFFREYIKEHDYRGRSADRCNFYNVGCMTPWMNYTPRTLDEIIEYERN